MRYRCPFCRREPFHNEKLGIRFCREHGFSTVPVIGGNRKCD